MPISRPNRILLAAALATALAAPAGANPLYLVGKLGNTDTSVTLGEGFQQVLAGDDNSSGIGLGLRFGRSYAIQVEYLDLGGVPGVGSVCGGRPGCLALSVPVMADSKALAVSLLPHVALTRRLALYGKLGFVSWDADVSRLDEAGKRFLDSFSREELLYGAGLRLELPGPFGAFGEYERLGDAFDSVSFGATLGF